MVERACQRCTVFCGKGYGHCIPKSRSAAVELSLGPQVDNDSFAFPGTDLLPFSVQIVSILILSVGMRFCILINISIPPSFVMLFVEQLPMLH